MSAQRYRFGDYELDVESGELIGPTGRQRLPPKPAALLSMLLERPGELVTRDELRRRLWPEVHVDFDQSLHYCIRQVRLALGEDAASPRFIETLARRGYRLQVERVDRPVAPSRWVFRNLGLVAVGLAAVALALMVWRPPPAPAVSGAAPQRLALLPLGDSPPGDSQGEVASRAVNDRLTERLVVELTGHAELEVVGPATTRAIALDGRAQTEIGEELDVDWVLSGGFRPSSRVLFLQLIRVTDGGHVFARRYEGSPREIESRLSEAARQIAEAATTSR